LRGLGIRGVLKIDGKGEGMGSVGNTVSLVYWE